MSVPKCDRSIGKITLEVTYAAKKSSRGVIVVAKVKNMLQCEKLLDVASFFHRCRLRSQALEAYYRALGVEGKYQSDDEYRNNLYQSFLKVVNQEYGDRLEQEFKDKLKGALKYGFCSRNHSKYIESSERCGTGMEKNRKELIFILSWLIKKQKFY
ncbi:MAG: hypothetical protein AB4290_30705 [Spirulina sp.]